MHEPLVAEHSKNFRDIALEIGSLKERVSVLETNDEHLDARLSARDEEIKAISGLVFEIKQMRIDFNKVADVVESHASRLDLIQNKPGQLSLMFIVFVGGIVVTKLIDILFSLI